MSLGKLKSAVQAVSAAGPTLAQVSAARLAEACGREDIMTRRAMARIGRKTYVKAMPTFVDAHGGRWRARRIETACPRDGLRCAEISEESHAFPSMGACGPRDGYETACGRLIYGRSQAGHVASWLTCRACRSVMTSYVVGSDEQ